MLLDYSTLSEAIKPMVEELLDHHHLNETLNSDMPTSEFVARFIYGQLRAIPALTDLVSAVEIDETCTSSCRYERVED
jgi:6-pyruvoyltetrahydropterin/6-carboxytetrahydropterin synthase